MNVRGSHEPSGHIRDRVKIGKGSHQPSAWKTEKIGGQSSALLAWITGKDRQASHQPSAWKTEKDRGGSH